MIDRTDQGSTGSDQVPQGAADPTHTPAAHPTHAAGPFQPAELLPPVPNFPGVDPDALKNLLMSWFYAGYYTAKSELTLAQRTSL